MSSQPEKTPSISPIPKSVSISPAEVTEPILRQLQESSYSALRNLTLEFDRGTLTLFGQLPSYYLKQLVIALACEAPDVDEVIDRISVGEVPAVK